MNVTHDEKLEFAQRLGNAVGALNERLAFVFDALNKSDEPIDPVASIVGISSAITSAEIINKKVLDIKAPIIVTDFRAFLAAITIAAVISATNMKMINDNDFNNIHDVVSQIMFNGDDLVNTYIKMIVADDVEFFTEFFQAQER